MVSVDVGELTLAIYVTVLSGVLIGVVLRSAASIRIEFQRDMAALGQRIDSRIDSLQSEMVIMRSDLTQVALAVGARPRAITEDG